MKISAFGEFTIDVVPAAENPEIMNVSIGAANRKDVVSMSTNRDETVDQFCTRLRSMLRGLSNGERRVLAGEEVASDKKKKDVSWEEQKAAMKRGPEPRV